MKRYMAQLLGVLLAVSLVLPGAAGAKTLNYRLKWLFNASTAGDILAVDAGFFERAGLYVKVKEGGPGKDAIKELELGYADFGVASGDQVIRALDKGADVVVLAQIFQVNPLQWIYRADLPEISRLEDLKGRHIGVTFGGNDDTIMSVMLARGNLSKEDVRLYSVRFDFSPFLKKEVEIWPVYRNTQGVILEERLAAEGERVQYLNPSEFGVDFVANSIVTSGRMIEEEPELVKKFLKALLLAWEAAMTPDNKEAVVAAIKKRDRTSEERVCIKQLKATRKLVKPLPEFKIGAIDVAAWQQTEVIMLGEKQIRNPVNIESKLLKNKDLP